MRSPIWKRLVEELTDSGYESPYLDRLRNRLDVYQAHNELEKEILREMASALGRTEDRVNLALLELELIGREIESLMAEQARNGCWFAEVNRRIDGFNRQREVVKRHLWHLVIHREALGFRRNEILKQFYPVPPKKERVERCGDSQSADLEDPSANPWHGRD